MKIQYFLQERARKNIMDQQKAPLSMKKWKPGSIAAQSCYPGQEFSYATARDPLETP